MRINAQKNTNAKECELSKQNPSLKTNFTGFPFGFERSVLLWFCGWQSKACVFQNPAEDRSLLSAVWKLTRVLMTFQTDNTSIHWLINTGNVSLRGTTLMAIKAMENYFADWIESANWIAQMVFPRPKEEYSGMSTLLSSSFFSHPTSNYQNYFLGNAENEKVS